MQEFDDMKDDICPNCGVGHIHMGCKPYLKLFHQQLFTIPDAVCYICDICNYLEYDDSTFDVINDMMFGATRFPGEEGNTRPLPSPPDDDVPQRGKPPHF